MQQRQASIAPAASASAARRRSFYQSKTAPKPAAGAVNATPREHQPMTASMVRFVSIGVHFLSQPGFVDTNSGPCLDVVRFMCRKNEMTETPVICHKDYSLAATSAEICRVLRNGGRHRSLDEFASACNLPAARQLPPAVTALEVPAAPSHEPADVAACSLAWLLPATVSSHHAIIRVAVMPEHYLLIACLDLILMQHERWCNVLKVDHLCVPTS